MATRDAAEQVRRSALPGKPEDYKVATSANFKPPEGIEFKIDENNPLWAQARNWAQKSGLTQDQFHEAIDLFAGSQVADAATIKAARDAEVAKLGANGTARVTAVNTFLDAAGVGGLKDRLFTAADVQAMEKLVAKFSSQGAASFNGAHRVPQQSGSLVSDEEFSKMTPAQRLDYTRSPAAQAAMAARARSN